MQYTSIKFIPTGNVFKLPTSDAEKIISTDRGNYEIVGGKYIPEPEEIVEETSTYNKVVGEEKGEDNENSEQKDSENNNDDNSNILSKILNKVAK